LVATSLADDPANSWYLVHTKPRQEAAALVQLERQGYTCYLPYIQAERIRRNKARIASEPLFPRYLFIRLSSSQNGKSWAPIRSTLGVSKLVQFGQRAASVADALIEALKRREQALPMRELFQAGDAVTITAGIFAGLDAVYQTSNAERRAMILLEILSKPIALQIDPASLIKTN
jgi:transcriptional antiterminator RfaH